MKWSVVLVIFLAVPSLCAASVTISEVAWMGDATSANYEWIELHNDGEAATVDGWVLEDGMNLSIELVGTIGSGEYVILERNRSDGQYHTSSPFLIYTGALVNTGATLVLKRADGGVEDQVSGGENWQTIGGDNTTKETAQYTTSGWRTGTPTPGEANTATVVPDTLLQTPATSSASSNSSGSSKSKSSAKSDTVKLALPPNKLAVSIDIQKTAYVHQSIGFTATATGLGTTLLSSLQYNWNFGDLGTSSSRVTKHTYKYPGTYVVSVEAAFAGHRQIVHGEVTVLPVTLALARAADGAIMIHNNATYDIDMSGYRLLGVTGVIFPPRTVIIAKGTLTLPAKTVLANYTTPLYLRDAMNMEVAKWPENKLVPASIVSDIPTESELLFSSVQTTFDISEETTRATETTEITTSLPPVAYADSPLVLAPTTEVESEATIPSYVYAGLVAEAAETTDTSPRSATVQWPYLALAGLLLAAMVGLLATPRNVSSHTPKITRER